MNSIEFAGGVSQFDRAGRDAFTSSISLTISAMCHTDSWVDPHGRRRDQPPVVRGVPASAGPGDERCEQPNRTHAVASGSCPRTAPLGARHNALVTGVACAPSGAAPFAATRCAFDSVFVMGPA